SARVEVRKTGLRALIDGTVVSTYHGDPARLDGKASEMRNPAVLALMIWAGPIEFHKADVREISGQGRITRPVPSSAPLDLPALVDPSKDAKTGQWVRQGTAIVGSRTRPNDQSRHAVLELPYRPPEEYDFTIEFTRRGGGGVSQYLALPDGRECEWVTGPARG